MADVESWYKYITEQIDSLRATLTRRDFQSYRLEMLLRLAKRISEFSGKCLECQKHKDYVTRLVADASDAGTHTKDRKKYYNQVVSRMIQHMKRTHKLGLEGENISIWVTVGMVIGVAMGTASDNIGVGIPIGLALGVAIGSYLDNKAKKEGKVI